MTFSDVLINMNTLRVEYFLVGRIILEGASRGATIEAILTREQGAADDLFYGSAIIILNIFQRINAISAALFEGDQQGGSEYELITVRVIESVYLQLELLLRLNLILVYSH